MVLTLVASSRLNVSLMTKASAAIQLLTESSPEPFSFFWKNFLESAMTSSERPSSKRVLTFFQQSMYGLA